MLTGILLLHFFEKVYRLCLDFCNMNFNGLFMLLMHLIKSATCYSLILLLIPMIYSYHDSEKSEKLAMQPKIICLYYMRA